MPGLAARYHLAASALAAADTPEELARLLHEVALAPLGVVAVVLGVLEPDGAVALVGSHGVEQRRVSQWQRVPPETGVPLVQAVHGGGVVWETVPEWPGAEERRARGPDGPPTAARPIVPGRIACAVPLRRGDRIAGAMSLGWDVPVDRARAATRYVEALAGLVAGHLLRVTASDGGEPELAVPGGEHWFRDVLDAVFEPVLVLSAVREGGDAAITDLRVVYANAAAGTVSTVGRRLTEVLPGLVTTGTFGRILDVAATGVRFEGRAENFTGTGATEVLTVRAVPFLDGVLVTWRPRNGLAERAARLGEAQRMAGLGSFSWTPGSAGLDLSEEALRLLGLDPGRTAPITPAEALDCVSAADRQAVRLVAGRLLAGQRTAALDFDAGPGDGAPRALRATAEVVADPAGETCAPCTACSRTSPGGGGPRKSSPGSGPGWPSSGAGAPPSTGRRGRCRTR
ncbi:hypothetical protein ACFQ0M_02395 [Kitasatospora aburaviensis]